MVYRILVPTDFSETANKARDYAIKLAETLNAEIYLLNAYHIPTMDAEATIAMNIENITKEMSVKNMKEQLKYVQENYSNIDFESKCVSGLMVDSIKTLTEKINFNLIVLGTNGTSGIVENFLGSNASAIIGAVDIPIIIVPANTTINFPKRIVVANDLTESGENQLYDSLKLLAGNIKASIDFLFIDDDKNKAVGKIEHLKAADFDEAFDTNYHPFHFRENENIEEGILDYLEGKNYDLLVVVFHQRSFWKRIFEKSVSKSLVKKAEIPVLVLSDLSFIHL